jgi:hypothetical protein
MSEVLEQAAAALGIPEPLVKRSAEARAADTGGDVDEILAAWAGGEAPSAPPVEPETEPEAEAAPEGEPETTEPEADPEGEPETPEPEAEEPEEPVPAPAPQPEVVVEVPAPAAAPAGATPAFAGVATPPVLVGVRDNPMAVLVGAIGLFLGVLLLGLVGPALPGDPPGARSSQVPYSEPGLEGRDVYVGLGCAFCHTQMVRPVVADVGLGAVTLSDTNQVLGVRRFGPDLSDVGSRLTAVQIEAIVAGFAGHPPHMLRPDDMAALGAYLSESRTSREEPEPAEGEGASEGSQEEPEA